MMSGMPLETCCAFNKLWNNKFYYKVASCWYFYWVLLRCTDPWILNLSPTISLYMMFWVNIINNYVLLGDRFPVGVRFSTPVQTDRGAHPASYAMGIGSFPGVNRPGRGVDHPPLCSAEFKKRVELYLSFSSGPSWPVLGKPLPLALIYKNVTLNRDRQRVIVNAVVNIRIP
jgi:hypothetical protein